MPTKLFTVEEANALLPTLQPLVVKLRDVAGDLRESQARVSVLLQQHTEAAIDAADNPDRATYWGLVRKGVEAEGRLQELLDELQFAGAEVKDMDLGLLDFRHKRGGEVVYLCWRLGEERIAYWHDLQSGFAGRKPLEELERRQP